MTALAIVEHLNELEDGRLGHLSSLEHLLFYQFELKCRKEALCHRIMRTLKVSIKPEQDLKADMGASLENQAER